MTNKPSEIKNIFLGGTCNDSTWRADFIKQLTIAHPEFSYFDPVVPDWTPACQDAEDFQKSNALIQVYCITPKMTGVFSIAEMIDASNKRPHSTIIIMLDTDGKDEWTDSQKRSMLATLKLATNNGASCSRSIAEAIAAIKPKAMYY